VDPESGAWRDADAGAVKRSYRERARAFALRARDLAREARIDHVLAPTDASPVEPLAEIVARRSRTRAR
jgi:hypothetical protein